MPFCSVFLYAGLFVILCIRRTDLRGMHLLDWCKYRLNAFVKCDAEEAKVREISTLSAKYHALAKDAWDAVWVRTIVTKHRVLTSMRL